MFLLQRKSGKVGAGLGKTTGWIHRAALDKAGVVGMGGVAKYAKVDNRGLHLVLKKPKVGRKQSPSK